MKPSLSITTPSIRRVTLDPTWPTLDLPILAYAELEKDEMFPLMDQASIPNYINQSIKKGQIAAQRFGKGITFKNLINKLLKEHVQIAFVPQLGIQGTVRAVYHKKNRRIEISRDSIQQIRSFFSEMGFFISEEDISLMHLVHEWFHHLEESTIGRTDKALPGVQYKRFGPFAWRKKVATCREIAAHTFTQAVLELSWSPLLLDYLLTFREQGESVPSIRHHFQQLKQRAIAALEPPTPNRTDSTNDTKRPS